MAQYKEGTVDVINASATILGTGTLWATYTQAGQIFMVDGTTVLYTISSVDSDTQITLTSVYAGSSASAITYSVTTDFTTNLSLYETDYQDKDWPVKLTQLMIRPLDTYLCNIIGTIALETKTAGWTLDMTKLTHIPKTYTINSATNIDESITFPNVVFTSADIGKKFKIINLNSSVKKVSIINSASSACAIDDSGTGAGDGIYTTELYGCITLELVSTTQWVTESASGSWTTTT